jgi:hypothetical protein
VRILQPLSVSQIGMSSALRGHRFRPLRHTTPCVALGHGKACASFGCMYTTSTSLHSPAHRAQTWSAHTSR